VSLDSPTALARTRCRVAQWKQLLARAREDTLHVCTHPVVLLERQRPAVVQQRAQLLARARGDVYVCTHPVVLLERQRPAVVQQRAHQQRRDAGWPSGSSS
jgi:hypothetical protein